MSKKNRMRDCPAAGRAIEAFECAEGRHTTYACPEHCPFNPFSASNYENYGKIEGGADTKFFNWLVKYSPNPDEFETRIGRALEDRPDSQFFHTFAWHSVYLKNPDGSTCLERGARQGFPGTSKDERLVLKAKMDMRPTIMEVQCILDDKRLQVVDLLDPARTPFIMVDRVLAKYAVRFGVYAVHAFPLPHFSRLFGTAYAIPSVPPFEPEEIIAEIIRHLEGGTDEQGKRLWLMEHYRLFEDALVAVGLARRKAMFDNLDAQFGEAVYELTAPFEGCRERLRGVQEIEEDFLEHSEEAEGFVEGRVWFAKIDEPEYDIVGEGAALGRILLGKTHWRIDCMGGWGLTRFGNGSDS